MALDDLTGMLAENGYITGQTINVNGGWLSAFSDQLSA